MTLQFLLYPSTGKCQTLCLVGPSTPDGNKIQRSQGSCKSPFQSDSENRITGTIPKQVLYVEVSLNRKTDSEKRAALAGRELQVEGSTTKAKVKGKVKAKEKEEDSGTTFDNR